jgi:serine/threonine protein kinase
MQSVSGTDERRFVLARTATAVQRISSADETLAPGMMLGEYRIEYELGRGGMGRVYAARHPIIGKRVAIKVLAPERGADPVIARRFVEEARAVNRIRHPNVIDIFAFGQHPNGLKYFVMEYLEGETLGARIAREPMSLAQARGIFVQIASGLTAAHRVRLVHRDIKPDNLWIARGHDGQPQIKILDFGIAKTIERSGAGGATHAGSLLGTAHFMAPEQCSGQRVDHRADIYALGVVLYLVFTGALPFTGASFAEVVAQHVHAPLPHGPELRSLPPALRALIVRCLAKSPADRPQSAAEFGSLVAAALGDASEPPARQSTMSDPGRPERGRPLPATVSEHAHAQSGRAGFRAAAPVLVVFFALALFPDQPPRGSGPIAVPQAPTRSSVDNGRLAVVQTPIDGGAGERCAASSPLPAHVERGAGDQARRAIRRRGRAVMPGAAEPLGTGGAPDLHLGDLIHDNPFGP